MQVNGQVRKPHGTAQQLGTAEVKHHHQLLKASLDSSPASAWSPGTTGADADRELRAWHAETPLPSQQPPNKSQPLEPDVGLHVSLIAMLQCVITTFRPVPSTEMA